MDRYFSGDTFTESEIRAAEDKATRDWTECNFVKYKKVIDSTQLCPPVTSTAAAGA